MIAVRVNPGVVCPGRPALAGASVPSLRGPGSGAIQLPSHLSWSAVDGKFSPNDPAGRREEYPVVPGEARHPSDLAEVLECGPLTALRPGLFPLVSVRQARKDRHTALRARGRADPAARISAAAAGRTRQPYASRVPT